MDAAVITDVDGHLPALGAAARPQDVPAMDVPAP
jgi:hypothetical protein